MLMYKDSQERAAFIVAYRTTCPKLSSENGHLILSLTKELTKLASTQPHKNCNTPLHSPLPKTDQHPWKDNGKTGLIQQLLKHMRTRVRHDDKHYVTKRIPRYTTNAVNNN